MLHVQSPGSPKKHAVYRAISNAGLVPIKKLLPALLNPFHVNATLISGGCDKIVNVSQIWRGWGEGLRVCGHHTHLVKRERKRYSYEYT